MLRTVWFLGILGVSTAVAVWLAEHPGAVTLHWQGYRLDTSFAILLSMVSGIVVSVALFYRLWIYFRGVPARVGRARRDGRRRRGYMALTRGMVAVAAGDADEARRQSERADVLLGDPPLTMLLAAQSAQLRGDEKASESFFTSMLDRPETEFLGVRGLLMRAMKQGQWDEALKLARRAYRLKPKSEWVAATLLDMQVRAGQWADADITLGESVKKKLIGGESGNRRKAVIAYRRGIEAEAEGRTSEALKLVTKAHTLEPGLIPAVVAMARLLTATNKARKATTLIEQAWRRDPHRDLFAVFRAALPAGDALQNMRTVQNLARLNADHPESHIAVAEAALEAQLWGEARKHLNSVAGNNASARVCRLMARLEESQHGDMTRTREWLVRASMADPDPMWVCRDCGNAVAEWDILCGKCGSFDSFDWHTPPRVVSLSGPPSRPTLADAGGRAV
jgi:HemY protein